MLSVNGCSSVKNDVTDTVTERSSLEEDKYKKSDIINGNYLGLFELYGYSGYPSFEEAFEDSQFIDNLIMLNQQLHENYNYLEMSFQAS